MMRTIKEIEESIGNWELSNYQSLMLEIMCNIVITLDKIMKQGEPQIRIKEKK